MKTEVMQHIASLVMMSAGLSYALAQEGPTYTIEKDWRIVESQRADFLFHQIQEEFANGSFDPLAQPLLDSAERFTRVVFQTNALTPVRFVTLRGDEGDVIVAEWRFRAPVGEGSMVLRDTPFYSQYVFRLSDYNAKLPEDIPTILEKLMVMGEPPIHVTTAALGFSLSGETPPRGFSGSFRVPRRSNAFVQQFSLLGASTSDGFFLAVRLGKGFTSTYYSVPPFIPERFPALKDLLPTWSSVRIRGELGRLTTKYTSLVEFRDGILMAELAKRGISQELFLDVLENTDGVLLEERATSVINAMLDAGQHDQIVRYFRPALVMYERLGSPANEAVLLLFRAALQSCPAEVDGDIVRLFKAGLFQRAALSYFEHCTRTPDRLRLVEDTTVEDELTGRKAVVLNSIRTRLAHGPGVRVK